MRHGLSGDLSRGFEHLRWQHKKQAAILCFPSSSARERYSLGPADAGESTIVSQKPPCHETFGLCAFNVSSFPPHRTAGRICNAGSLPTGGLRDAAAVSVTTHYVQYGPSWPFPTITIGVTHHISIAGSSGHFAEIISPLFQPLESTHDD